MIREGEGDRLVAVREAKEGQWYVWYNVIDKEWINNINKMNFAKAEDVELILKTNK